MLKCLLQANKKSDQILSIMQVEQKELLQNSKGHEVPLPTRFQFNTGTSSHIAHTTCTLWTNQLSVAFPDNQL
jgi:hypothetical protein